MATDATNLERSTLERKERAELATIAEALGRKPGSRAKKSDIVDLILELAGVATPQNDEVATPQNAAAPTPAGNADSEAPDAATDDQDAATAEPVGEAQSPKAPDRSRTSPTGNGQQASNDSTPKHEVPQHESPQRDASTPGTSGSSGGTDDDGESANKRRRRRRGRDRAESGGSDQQGEWDGETLEVAGLLDLRDDGYGFLRVNGFLPSRDDVYVSVKQCRQLGLRKGDHVAGAARPPGRQEKNPSLLRVETVNGLDPEQSRQRPRFDQLTPLYPDSPLHMEHASVPGDMTGRVIDLIAPIGKGQRGLIVSPPKAGKTTVMKRIANAIEANNPEVHLIVLLIDERPEEVTDFKRSISGGEVVASTFDRPVEEHIMVAELTIEHAKRMVEYGNDVVIILDGITRLARAYNLAAPSGGRIMSGGLDTGALYPPKKFFGAARNVEEGGSLTILASALVDTGSAMDNVIFEEFKGTGNLELRLDRRAADKRIFPAIDVEGSSTRHEELLFDPRELPLVIKLRRAMAGVAADSGATGSLELLIERMKSFPTNQKFLAELAKAPSGGPTS